MLWYKAWIESRTRFIITVLVISVFCVSATVFQGSVGPARVGQALDVRANNLIYAGTAKGVFGILSIFLGLGGMLRERARRTAAFTLALPASRREILTAQVSVGMTQLALLSLLPTVLLPASAALLHQSFPVSTALHFSPLWFVGGLIIYAASYLLSVLFEGEFTAPVAGYILIMLQALVADWRPLRPYRTNILWTMAETGPIPWLRLFELTIIAAILFVLALRRTQNQDF